MNEPTYGHQTNQFLETLIEVATPAGVYPLPARPRLELERIPAVLLDIDELPEEVDEAYMSAIFENKTLKAKLSSGQDLQTAPLVPKPPSGTLLVLDIAVEAIRVHDEATVVHFAIINFHAFTHPHYRTGEQFESSPLYTRLATPGWVIDFWNVAGSEIPMLREYKITHWGEIRSEDGNPFAIDEAKKLLDTLALFLSFARGGHCGLSLIHGDDEGGLRVWELWKMFPVIPWSHLDSWFEPSGNSDLQEVFHGFYEAFSNTSRDDKTLVALEWYLQSNIQEAAPTSIVLSQAALERLAFVHVGTRSGPAGTRIAKALEHLGIPIEVPAKLPYLANWQDGAGPDHGPHILVEIRDELIHQDTRRKAVSPEVYSEARTLGLWYVELMLLKQFGHGGNYYNRICQRRGHMPGSTQSGQ